jgi:glycosyltransferase involved in cell wall biosynthesis
MPTDKRNQHRDIVFVSLEDWDEIWRRNQFVCDELAGRNPDRRILFVGLPRNVSNALRRGRIGEAFSSPKPKSASRENILITSAIKLLPNTLTAGRRINEMLLRRHLRREMKRLAIHQPLLWLNDQSAVHLVGRMGESGVIYDITDDWTTLTQSPRLTELIRLQDRNLCSAADAVIVCSERLREMKAPLARNLHLIPNGVNASHYQGNGNAPPPGIPWKHPIIGYVGTIHPDRIDVELIAGVAREMPDWSIALIGPNHLYPETMQQLKALPNIYFVGPVPYAQVPAYMRAFDVCMTPHRVTPFTESLNPIKLWEYLAVGKPIVSTDVAGFRDFPRWVSIASTSREFAEAARRGLEEDPAVSAERRAEALKHSWAARVDAIEAVIAACGRSGAVHG